ncbi:hypothetical protein ACS0TY_025167 [Phlomoides rotata]
MAGKLLFVKCLLKAKGTIANRIGIHELIKRDQETCIFLQCQPLTRCTVQMQFQWKEEKTVASQSRNPQLATVNGDSSFGDQQRSGLWFQLPTQGIKTYAQILSHNVVAENKRNTTEMKWGAVGKYLFV